MLHVQPLNKSANFVMPKIICSETMYREYGEFLCFPMAVVKIENDKKDMFADKQQPNCRLVFKQRNHFHIQPKLGRIWLFLLSNNFMIKIRKKLRKKERTKKKPHLRSKFPVIVFRDLGNIQLVPNPKHSFLLQK